MYANPKWTSERKSNLSKQQIEKARHQAGLFLNAAFNHIRNNEKTGDVSIPKRHSL